MKLYFPTRAQAQAVADRIHAERIAKYPDVAKSAQKGETTCWCVPAQDLDDKGSPIGTEWFIIVKDRCIGETTTQERAKLDVRADGKTPEQIKEAQAAQALTGK